MATNTTSQIALLLTLDGQEYACQVIDVSMTHVGSATGETIEVACPDGVVVEDGESTNGSLTGEVFTDTTDTGISWALMQAHSASALMTYSVTWFSDQANTVAYVYSGDCQVATFQMDWTKPGKSRHPLDLELVTGTISRPA